MLDLALDDRQQNLLMTLKQSMTNESNKKNIDNKINEIIDNKEVTNFRTNDKVHSKDIIMKKDITRNDRTKYNDLQWGEVLYVDLDQNGANSVGSEQKGTRFAICVQNLVGNKYSPTTIVLFLTSQMTKSRLPTHCEIKAGNFGLPKDSVVLAEQIRTLDKSRIIKRVGKIDELTALKIEKAMQVSTARKLERKNTLERLANETRNYIINSFKMIDTYKTTIETMKENNVSITAIGLIEDRKFMDENGLKCYCDKNRINYDLIYNDYQEIIKEKEVGIAL